MTTVKGKYCSPAHGGDGSCYSKPQLVHIAQAYNRRYKGNININGNKDQLWNDIERAMIKTCDNEKCWSDTLGIDNTRSFRPYGPADTSQWLSTADIHNVLKQYEDVYPDFVFMGPMPIDFCKLANNEVCNINFNTLKRNGKTKIGIVFNTDPSTKGGKHWISMFIDISNPDPSQHEIGYFDSFGMAPLLPEIKELVRKLRQQNPLIRIKLNCSDQLCMANVQHQTDDTECGVYSISFIVARLSGRSWEDIVLHNRWSSRQMKDMRRVYFRPKK